MTPVRSDTAPRRENKLSTPPYEPLGRHVNDVIAVRLLITLLLITLLKVGASEGNIGHFGLEFVCHFSNRIALIDVKNN
jgi:hypothetical protein